MPFTWAHSKGLNQSNDSCSTPFSWGNCGTKNNNQINRTLKRVTKDWGKEVKLENTDPRWITAAPPPDQPSPSLRTPLVMLNDEEFVLSVEHKQGIKRLKSQLIKYNAHRDEWTVFVDLPRPQEMNVKAFTIDQKKQRMYFCTNGPYKFYPNTSNNTPSYVVPGSNREMVVVNLRSGRVVYESSATPSEKPRPYTIMLNVNGSIHKLHETIYTHSMPHGSCGVRITRHNGHDLWNKQQQIWESTKNGMDGIKNLGSSALYVPSKDIILMFGAKGIWRYRIGIGQWEVSQNQANFDNAGIVLTFDEKHVIIVGGGFQLQVKGPGIKDLCPIHVLDISNDNRYQLWKSSILVPKRTAFVARSRNHRSWRKLTFGWLRRKQASLPSVIMNLIAQFGSQEMIHCVTFQQPWRNWHHKIALEDIMSSLKPTDGKSSVNYCT